MRSRSGAVAAVVITAAAVTAAAPARVAAAPGTAPVLGGADVPEGTWRDAAGVVIDGFVDCSAVLVAPTVALTAGHCDDPALTDVIVGTNDLSHPERGETLAVAARITYPDYRDTFDVTALVLATPSTVTPRAIATGWAAADIADEAAVTLVGFGAIDRDGTEFVDALQAADTVITDATCAGARGCNAAARPAGELGAGGMGRDTCPGDSGGPLYLRTAYGDFVAGLTSRGYDGADSACEDGGIYVRPDAIVGWVEDVTGVAIARGPEPSAPALEMVRGDGAEVAIDAGDPAADEHDFAIAAPPAFGRATVDGDGRLAYCSDPARIGADTVVVAITDARDDARRVELAVAIDVRDGTPAPECSVELAGGGCCSAGTPLDLGTLVPVLVVGAAMVRRRRRR
jgi:endonuclease G